MKKIKQNDEVIVIAGKDKGRQGKVLRAVGDRFYVSGINMVKRHTKPNPAANRPGGIIEKEATIHKSNVALFNADKGKADRVGFRMEDEKKVRFFKSTNKVVD